MIYVHCCCVILFLYWEMLKNVTVLPNETHRGSRRLLRIHSSVSAQLKKKKNKAKKKTNQGSTLDMSIRGTWTVLGLQGKPCHILA